MAELFANFKAYDVQAARAKAMAEGRAEGHAEGHAAGRAEGRAEGRMQEREEGMKKLVKTLRKYSLSIEEIAVNLAEQYELTEVEALEKVKLFWN